MKILIGADLVPTESNKDLFVSGDIDALLGQELRACLSEADYRIFNLEVPLTNIADPIPKCGPNLIAAADTVKAYSEMGVDLVTLANNHTMDQGAQGMASTCRTLTDANISFLGAGDNISTAAKPYIACIKGEKIGIYACCEHEFGIASEQEPGANPFDPLESLGHISKLKAECDKVIVLYHGGKEHYRYPSPNLRKVCRKIIESSASVVICQHSHCIGCEEKYLDGTIVYGQGNFLFDLSESEYWQTSLLLSLDEEMNVSYLPLIKHGNGVRLAKGEESNQILNDFRRRSEEITQDGFVEKKYKEFADAMVNNYLFTFSGVRRTFFYKVFDKLSGHRLTSVILKRKYKLEKRLALRNFIECEAHRELLLQGIKKENNQF